MESSSRCDKTIKFIFLVLIFSSLHFFKGVSGASGPGDPFFEPSKTRVFVVGVLEWNDSRTFSSFPKKNRRDEKLVNFFKGAGVPSENIVYLKDGRAKADAIREKLSGHLSKSRPDETLFLYYCGHGYRSSDDGETFFASRDSGADGVSDWSLKSIFADIEGKFKGRRAILAADCCHSGTLCDIASKSGGDISYACLASAAATNSSTGNWTFTERLLLGFSGAACSDTDGDGVITLGELAENIAGDMAFAEEQMAASKLTGEFRSDMAVAEAKKKRDKNIGRRIEAKSGGDWYRALVLDSRKGESLVHYFGWEESSDEWLKPVAIREAPKNREYEKGSAVEVEWEGKWYPATVIKVDCGLHYVHYKDFDDGWDEWAGPSRMRIPKKIRR